jgi:hypothetical protein
MKRKEKLMQTDTSTAPDIMFTKWPKKENNYSIQRKESMWESRCGINIFTLTELDLWVNWYTFQVKSDNYCHFSSSSVCRHIIEKVNILDIIRDILLLSSSMSVPIMQELLFFKFIFHPVKYSFEYKFL